MITKYVHTTVIKTTTPDTHLINLHTQAKCNYSEQLKWLQTKEALPKMALFKTRPLPYDQGKLKAHVMQTLEEMFRQVASVQSEGPCTSQRLVQTAMQRGHAT